MGEDLQGERATLDATTPPRSYEIAAAAKCLDGYADSRFLPLERRAARTLRPPTVLLRAKYPWRRLRFRLLGWNVRFIAIHRPKIFEGRARNR
jgi:hypothetical protein